MIFFIICNNRKFKSCKRKDNERYKKSFQTKKEQSYTAIKQIRDDLFRQEKETKVIKATKNTKIY